MTTGLACILHARIDHHWHAPKAGPACQKSQIMQATPQCGADHNKYTMIGICNILLLSKTGLRGGTCVGGAVIANFADKGDPAVSYQPVSGMTADQTYMVMTQEGLPSCLASASFAWHHVSAEPQCRLSHVAIGQEATCRHTLAHMLIDAQLIQ